MIFQSLLGREIYGKPGWRQRTQRRAVQPLLNGRLHFVSEEEDVINLSPGNLVTPMAMAIRPTSSDGDSALVAVADEDGTITIACPESKSREQDCYYDVHTFQAHDNAVFDVAWLGGRRTGTPYNKLLSASGDHSVKLWDAEALRQISVFGGELERDEITFGHHHGSVKCVAPFNNNPHMFVTTGRDGCALIWDTRIPAQSIGGQESVVHAIGRFSELHDSRDTAYLLASSASLTASPFFLRGSLNVPTRSPMAGSISMDSVFASPAVPSRRRRKAVTPHTVTSCLVAHDDQVLITGGASDGAIKFWDMRVPTRECQRRATRDLYNEPQMQNRCRLPTLDKRPDPVHTIMNPITSQTHKRHGITSMELDERTGTKLLVNYMHSDVVVYDWMHTGVTGHGEVKTYNSTSSCGEHKYLCESFYVKSSFSPCGDYIASGSSDCKVYMWEVNGKTDKEGEHRPLHVLQGHTKEVTGVGWLKATPHFTKIQEGESAKNSEDGMFGQKYHKPGFLDDVVSVSDDGMLRIWRGTISEKKDTNKKISSTKYQTRIQADESKRHHLEAARNRGKRWQRYKGDSPGVVCLTGIHKGIRQMNFMEQVDVPSSHVTCHMSHKNVVEKCEKENERGCANHAVQQPGVTRDLLKDINVRKGQKQQQQYEQQQVETEDQKQQQQPPRGIMPLWPSKSFGVNSSSNTRSRSNSKFTVRAVSGATSSPSTSNRTNINRITNRDTVMATQHNEAGGVGNGTIGETSGNGSNNGHVVVGCGSIGTGNGFIGANGNGSINSTGNGSINATGNGSIGTGNGEITTNNNIANVEAPRTPVVGVVGRVRKRIEFGHHVNGLSPMLPPTPVPSSAKRKKGDTPSTLLDFWKRST